MPAAAISELRRRFERECAGSLFLDPADPGAINRHLRALGWLDGERRPVIPNHSRPWVEKYREIPVPRGCVYLAERRTLLDGDYFPGSWLRTGRSLFVIDPELCVMRCAEFDIGTLSAHLILTGHLELWPTMRARYTDRPDWHLVDKQGWLELSRTLVCA